MGKDTSALSDTFLNTPNTVEVGEGLSINAFPITGAPGLDTALITLINHPPFSMLFRDVLAYMEPGDIKVWADFSKSVAKLEEALVEEIWALPQDGSEPLDYIVIGGISAYALRKEDVVKVVENEPPARQMVIAISEELYAGLYVQVLSNPSPKP